MHGKIDISRIACIFNKVVGRLHGFLSVSYHDIQFLSLLEHLVETFSLPQSFLYFTHKPVAKYSWSNLISSGL